MPHQLGRSRAAGTIAHRAARMELARAPGMTTPTPPMTTVEQTWTHFPGTRYTQPDLAALLPRWLPPDRVRVAEPMFRRAAVEHRSLVLAPDEAIARGKGFAAKNELYRRAVASAVTALTADIDASVSPERRADIDLLVTASCTGFQIPAMDALVIRALDLPKGLRRVNLTEHGCAAGAAAIGLCHEWLAARPDRRALVVCAELCSLAFQPEDTSVDNLVSAAIFGDGAAAVLLAGPDVPPEPNAHVTVGGTFRELFRDTEHFMGFEVNDAGLKIKLSRDVVGFSRTELPSVFARACEAWGVASPQAFAMGSMHPGGRRILEILEQEVGLSRSVTQTGWDALREHGNLSSVTVLVALDRLVHARTHRAGDLGILSAFGPGFGTEMSLLEVAA
jgi:alkylresorcinol/alkylpyrone synthase